MWRFFIILDLVHIVNVDESNHTHSHSVPFALGANFIFSVLLKDTIICKI